MWEQDAAAFLNDPALLPLAPLAATATPEQLLTQAAQQVSKIEPTPRRREVSAYAQILAGLRFNKRLVKQLFREGVMRESVIYQEILQEGLQEGRQLGLEQGRQEGLQEGRQEGRQAEGTILVLRLLTRRFGTLEEATRLRIAALPLPLLEDLGEALLDFSQASDLQDWLERHQPSEE
jgi:predicted transposase YdaD